jgi:hypothetical protein
MTRAEAWAQADKLRRANPGIDKVEPIDPDADKVQGLQPNGAGK